MLHGPKKTQARARQLRRTMTLPEVLLWQALRRRPAGLRFRKQHPAGRYVLDFFCPARRLAVEVDGEAHNRGSQPAYDAERDQWLRDQGVRVLRIRATDVLNELDAVVRQIVAAALGADYPSTASGGPPPPSGGGMRRAVSGESRTLAGRRRLRDQPAGYLSESAVRRLVPQCHDRIELAESICTRDHERQSVSRQSVGFEPKSRLLPGGFQLCQGFLGPAEDEAPERVLRLDWFMNGRGLGRNCLGH